MIDPVLIERLADAAWPAEEQLPLGPWKLRATHGVTRRANSVLTAGHDDAGEDDLLNWITAAETFYACRSLPAVFQISAATGTRLLDQMLAARGYTISGASEVWTRNLGPKTAAQNGSPCPIHRSDDPDADWFDCAFDELPERRRVHEQIVRRTPRPRTFVTATDGTQRAGCGMGTSAQGCTGIFCMATLEPFRRRGVGFAMVQHLCTWAAALGDRRAFLQVMVENEPAKRLYSKAGFVFAYGYHYRVKTATTISR